MKGGSASAGTRNAKTSHNSQSKSFLATKGSNDSHSYSSGSYAQQKRKRVSEVKAVSTVKSQVNKSMSAKSGQATPKKELLYHQAAAYTGSFVSEVTPSNQTNSRLQERIMTATALQASKRVQKQGIQYQSQLHQYVQ
jgi:hypothetical protein